MFIPSVFNDFQTPIAYSNGSYYSLESEFSNFNAEFVVSFRSCFKYFRYSCTQRQIIDFPIKLLFDDVHKQIKFYSEAHFTFIRSFVISLFLSLAMRFPRTRQISYNICSVFVVFFPFFPLSTCLSFHLSLFLCLMHVLNAYIFNVINRAKLSIE